MPSRSKFTGFCEHNRALGRECFADKIPLTPATRRISASRRASIGLVDSPPPDPAGCTRARCLWGKKLSYFEVVRGLSADEALIDGEAGCETTGEATSARS
jgi:hypothetical protein